VRSRFRRLIVPLAALSVALVAAGPAPARDGHTVRDSPLLWATVNVCDTIAHPDTIGIRGSIPGSGRPGERMYMRFQVQYFRAVDQMWHNIRNGGDSGFVLVGSAGFKARQAGRLFVFAPPAGGSWQLRGVVTFEWKIGAQVVRRVRERTTAGHRAAEADPPGYSSDTCVIS
jgi:hypothetical protein